VSINAAQLRFHLSLVLCAALAALNGRAAVIESNWNGGETGNWSAAANWTPSATYPKNGTDSYKVFVGGASVTLGEDIVIDSLALGDGDLNGAHALSVVPTGGLLFDGFSSLSGGLTLNVTGPFAFADNAAALTNHGTLVFKVSGSSNYTASTATLTNATDGTLLLDPTTAITLGGTALSPFRMVNEGLFSVGNGASNYVFAPINQTASGTTVSTGGSTLYLSTASNLGGTLQADAGSSIQLYGTGGQTHTLTQLAVTGAGSVSAHSTNLTGSLKSGTLLADTTTFTNTFTVESAATFLWGQQNAFAANSTSLTNRGVVSFRTTADGTYSTASTGSFVNASDGTVSFVASGQIGDSDTAPFNLINQGTILANTGTSHSIFTPVSNSGTIRSTANSTLYLKVASDLGGTLQADAGSTIQLNGNNGQIQTLTQLAVTGAGSVSTHSTKLTGSLKSGPLAADNTTFKDNFSVETAATLLWDQQNSFAANTDSLTNHGTVRFRTVYEGTYSTASTASFVNASDGIVSFSASGQIGDSDTAPFNLVNQGTILADTGTDHRINTPVSNSGTIHATANSKIFLNAASNLGGTLQVDTGSGVYLEGDGVVGQLTQTLTQLVIAGSGEVATFLTKLTGSVKSGALLVAGTTFTNTFTVESAATLYWDPANAFEANTNSLTNHGIVCFRTTAEGNYGTGSTASFVNASDGTVSFVASGQIGDSDTAPFNLINQGTVLAGTGTSNYIRTPVTNSGTIRATANSALYLTVASNLGGTLQADTGSSIQLYGTGGQTQTLNQLAVTGAGSVSTHSTKLTGSLKAGSLSAESTTFSGGFSLEAAGTLHWGAQNRFFANTDTLLNHGYALFETVSTDFPAASTATFINAVDGVLAFASGGQIGSASISPFSLSNYGTVITGTAASNELRIPVTNFGTLNVTAGSTLGLGSTFTQNSGEVFVNQGVLTALSGQTLYFNGGTLRGAGTITAPLSLAYTGLEIGSGSTAGTLAVTGATSFGTGSSFRVDLNGTTQGTGYDRLNVTGAVALGGDLMVRVDPSFLSNIQSSNTFTVLSASSITGAFANVTTGQRAKLPSGLGSCLLTVNSTQVVLSNFLSSTLNTFLANANVPAALRAFDQDPDGDGITNLMEYALALNPMGADVGGLPTAQVSGGNLTLTYYKRRTDVVYEVITTTTLENPGSWTTTGVTQGTPDGNKKVTASVPLTGGKGFLRLRVNYAP
jgi:hypothetical protein